MKVKFKWLTLGAAAIAAIVAVTVSPENQPGVLDVLAEILVGPPQ